jgi:YVTN family beta-propeller protein
MILRRLSLVYAWPLGASAVLGLLLLQPGSWITAAGRPRYLSPICVAMSPDGSRLYATEHTGNALAVVDCAKQAVVASVGLPEGPVGVAVSPDGRRVYVACSGSDVVAVVNAASRAVEKKIKVGRGPYGVALSKDGTTLYVCNRFTNDVSVVATADGTEKGRIGATRQPTYCALAEASGTLLVGNALPLGSDNDPDLASVVTFVDTATRRKAGEVRLPLGSNQIGEIACSPDGQFAYVPHLLGRFLVPTTQIERGWMNTNALSVVNVARRELVATVLLDDLELGAANPVGVAVSADGARLYLSHRGSHEITALDRVALHAALDAVPADKRGDLANDLAFLVRAKVRQRWPSGGLGPCGIALSPDGAVVYAANYFSDSITAVRTDKGKVAATIALGPRAEMDLVRRGEFLFHDADLCFQRWQSCSSCHPDGRADGLMWDLMNDGLGNPKNTRSMVLSGRTPPAMSLGIREDMRTAAGAGIRFILFRQPDEKDVDALEAYINSLKPEPGPVAVSPAMKASVDRGRKIFGDQRVGCATCHPAPLFTNLKSYDVGTQGRYDAAGAFDTPTCVELYRTAPYLHDGSAATLADVLTTANRGDRHGHTSHLTKQQLRDLEAYLESL